MTSPFPGPPPPIPVAQAAVQVAAMVVVRAADPAVAPAEARVADPVAAPRVPVEPLEPAPAPRPVRSHGLATPPRQGPAMSSPPPAHLSAQPGNRSAIRQ